MMILIAIAIAIITGIILAFPVMLLWNYALVPAIPVINQITWMQSWGIMLLMNFLFRTTITYEKK